MAFSLRSIYLILIAGILLCGCSGNSSQPISPDTPESSPGLTVREEVDANSDGSGHYLMQYGYIYVDAEHPDGPKVEVVPVREGIVHLNILKFLEVNPCAYCFRIVDFDFPEPGQLNVDIRIIHPFDDLLFTVFDVRCILMFQGSHEFPVAGKSISDPILGDGALLNPDGYTALYNGSTITAPIGDLQKYYEGNLTTPKIPNSDINGYILYKKSWPSKQNSFYAHTSDIQTFMIKPQTEPTVLGYAVDASWAPPLNNPVVDPIKDFGPEANCPEAWKIEVENAGPGLTPEGGSIKLLIGVYDWQGKDDVHPVLIECPDLFDGAIEATWKEDSEGVTQYEVVIENLKPAPPGLYTCLISKEAQENNPSGQPWLDLTAYQVTTLEVAEIPFNLVDITPPWLNFSPAGICIDGIYAYVAGGYNGLHIFDVSDPADPVWVNSVEIQGKASRVAVSGEYAYMTCRIESYMYNLQIIDISHPESAYIVNTVETDYHAAKIAVVAGYAYVVGNHFLIINIENPESAYIVKTVVTGKAYDVAVSGGYAYVSSEMDWTSRLNIIDIDPPESAYIVNEVKNLGELRSVAMSDGYAYVVSNYGLHIIDVEPPDSAYIVNEVATSGNLYDVAVSGGYAYVTDYSDVLIIDIDSPESAYIVNIVIMPVAANHVAVSGGFAYVIDSFYSLNIIDIEPPESANIIKTVITTGSPNDLTISGGYAYVAENSNGLQIINIESPESPYIVNTVGTPYWAKSVAVSGGYAYVNSDTVYTSSLNIIDIEPPESAYIVNTVDMFGSPHDVAVSGSYAYATIDPPFDPYNPVYTDFLIINIDPPESAHIVRKITTGGAYGVTVSDGYAYIDGGGIYSGLMIFDIEPPESAYVVNTVDSVYVARDIAISGGWAYVADDEYGFKIIDIDPTGDAHLVKTIATPGDAMSVAVSGGYAYVADNESGLLVIDINPPGSAHIVDSIDALQGYATGVAVSGGYAYVADNNRGLRIIKLW